MISATVQRIIETMKRNETQAAIIEINRILKNKGDKLAESDKAQLALLKGTILIQCGQAGEAEAILKQYMQPGLDKSLHFFVNNLAKELDLIGELVMSISNAYPPEIIQDLYQMLICDHQFAEAAKIALKLYKEDEKQNLDRLFEYIVLTSQRPDMGGKIVELFLEKLETRILELKDTQRLNQLLLYKMRFLRSQKNLPKVAKLLESELFDEYCRNCEISLWLYQQDAQYYDQMLKYHYAVFRSHLNPEKFIMNFDAQLNLIKHFFTKDHKLEIKPLEQPFQNVPKDQLLNHIYNSCKLVLSTATNKQVLKSLILTCLSILEMHEQQNIDEITLLISRFYAIHGDKYSFCLELFRAITGRHQLVHDIIMKSQANFQNQESLTVSKINQSKLIVYLSENPLAHMEAVLKEYHSHPVPEKVEKGDRLLQDDFLLIAIDSLYDLNDYNKCIQALSLIDLGLRNSPYNFDFLMRQIIIQGHLGLVEQCIESLTRLDVKGVQFDTLGFTFAKAFLEFGGMFDQVEKKNTQALMFYLESLRESKKNLVIAFQKKNYEPFQEMHQFEDWIKNSYIKLIYYFVQSKLLQSNKKQEVNVAWYNSQIQQQLAKGITCSIDELRFQHYNVKELNVTQPKMGDYLGIYSDPQELYFDSLATEMLANCLDLDRIEQLKVTLGMHKGQNMGQYQLSKRKPLDLPCAKLNYLEQYSQFVQLERGFRVLLAQNQVSLASVSTNDQHVPEISFSAFNDIAKILKALDFEGDSTNSIRIASRFYSYTFPMIAALFKNGPELKKKLFKVYQKAKGELKQSVEKLHKAIQGMLNELKDQTLTITQQMLQKLNFEYKVEYGDQQFRQQISVELKNRNIILKSLIDEKIKGELIDQQK